MDAGWRVYRVRRHGSFLATRRAATAARELLEHDVPAGAHACGICIDFTGVEAMTIGFADEFLGKFYAALAAGDVVVQPVLMRGLNEETRETIRICLERRELLAATDDDGIRLIAAPEYLEQTYRHAVTLGRFRAGQVSELLGITPQNVNNRLRRLVVSGALTREKAAPSTRGGKEFEYAVPALA